MKDKRESFTLIELLVTVTFILLFSGLSIGYYSQYTETKKLENTSRRISSSLTLVRQHMISGDSSMCSPVPLATPAMSYYAFQIDNSKSYSIQPFCTSGTPKPVSFSNESNIIFITPLPPTPPLPVVTFYPVTGASVCNYIYIKDSLLLGPQQCRYVKISQSGAVSEGPCATCLTCPSSCP